MKKLKSAQTFTTLLAALKLSLIALQRYLPSLWDFIVKNVVPFFQSEELLQLSALLQQNEWTAWIWKTAAFLWTLLWAHCVLLAICLLVLLPLTMKLSSSITSLVLEAGSLLGQLAQWVIDYIARAQTKPVDLTGSEFVLIEFQSGKEQLIDILAARKVVANENLFSIRREDNGDVFINNGTIDHRLYHDQPYFPENDDEALKSVYRIPIR